MDKDLEMSGFARFIAHEGAQNADIVVLAVTPVQEKAMKRNRPAVMAREISQASRRLRTRILQSLLIHLPGKIKLKKGTKAVFSACGPLNESGRRVHRRGGVQVRRGAGANKAPGRSGLYAPAKRCIIDFGAQERPGSKTPAPFR